MPGTVASRRTRRIGAKRAAATPFVDPTSLSGLVGWWKADSLVLADGNNVASWADSSGNGKTATAAAGVQPVYKTAIQNGKPVLRFDAIDDGMVTGLALGTAFSVFVVFSSAAGTSANRRTIQGTNNWLVGPYGTSYQWYAGSFVTGAAIVAGAFHVATVQQSGGSGNFYMDSGLVGTNGTAGAPGSLIIGAGTGSPPYPEPPAGDIGEIVAYNTSLSAANRQSVETYLKARWATP